MLLKPWPVYSSQIWDWGLFVLLLKLNDTFPLRMTKGKTQIFYSNFTLKIHPGCKETLLKLLTLSEAHSGSWGNFSGKTKKVKAINPTSWWVVSKHKV